MNKTVSVVVNCYNHEPFIRECVLSIINQTYPNKIYIYDCGSTDGSQNVIHEFLYEYPKINSYDNKDTFPIGVERYLGVSLVHSDYVAIVDADDYWRLDKLEKQMAVFDSDPNIKLVFSDCYYVKQNKKTVQVDDFPIFVDENEVLPQTFHSRYPVLKGNHFWNLLTRYSYMPCPTLIFERKAFKELGIGPLHYTSAEDYYWVLKFTSKYKAAYVPEPLAYYRLHANQLTVKTPSRCTMEEIDVVKIAKNFRQLTPRQLRIVYRHLFWLYCKLIYKEINERRKL